MTIKTDKEALAVLAFTAGRIGASFTHELREAHAYLTQRLAAVDGKAMERLRKNLEGLDRSPNTLAARISWTDSVVESARKIAAAPSRRRGDGSRR